jgi:hypothetical protein
MPKRGQYRQKIVLSHFNRQETCGKPQVSRVTHNTVPYHDLEGVWIFFSKQ